MNLISAQYQDRQDSMKSWIYASRGNAQGPDAVVIVPFHEDENKLVVIREFRVPLQGNQYGFPAGLMDPGESIEQAGKRELLEETGLRVTRVIKQSPAVFSSSGMTDESISLLYVRCKGIPSTQFNESSEQIDVMMLSREDAKDLLARPGLKFDVKSWIVLDRFASEGSII